MLGCGVGSTAARRGRNVGLRERTRVRHGPQTAQACKIELTRVQSDQDLEYVPLGIPVPNPTDVARSLSSYDQTNQDARVELEHNSRCRHGRKPLLRVSRDAILDDLLVVESTADK